MINTVCFVEIPSDDFESLQGFYGSLFGWKFRKVPGDFRYFEIDMGQDFPKGGMTARQDETHTAVSYVRVESVDDSLEQAVKLQAQVVVPKKPVPGAGWFAVLLDPQGNRLGLWQEDPAAA